MDASKLQLKSDTFINSTASRKSNRLESNEPAIAAQPDNDPDASPGKSAETVKLSDTSLKLSTSAPVKNIDKPAPIANTDQAQQALNQLIADFQSSPAQAQAAHGNIFNGAVKSLLG